MGKHKIKSILTFLYSAIISTFFCFVLYLISFKSKINFRESLFLIGLVFILIGIVVLISKSPMRSNVFGSRHKSGKDEYIDEAYEEVVKPAAKTFLLGFNRNIIVLVGVLLLIVDVFLK